MSIPYRLANGPGNIPDADSFMANYDWLTALLYRSFIINGGMESWNAGTSFSNPVNGTLVADSWTYRKSGGTPSTTDVSRDTGSVHTGSYSLKFNITGAGSADSLVALDQSIASFTTFAGLTVLFGARIKVSTASKVRLKITDGITTSYGSYHTGDGTFQLLQIALTCSASISVLTVSIEVTSDFTGSIYADSISMFIIPALMSATAQALLEYSYISSPEALVLIFGIGGGPVVTTPDGAHTYRLGVDNDGNPNATPLT